MYHHISGQFTRNLTGHLLCATDCARCTKGKREGLLSSTHTLRLQDLIAMCPKSIMEEMDEGFIWPKRFPWTAIHPTRHHQISQSTEWVYPSQRRYLDVFCLEEVSVSHEVLWGMFYSSRYELPSILSLKCRKWNVGGYMDLFTIDICLKCFQRYFLTKEERTCQTLCCNMLWSVSCLERVISRTRLPCFNSQSPAWHVCSLKLSVPPFSRLYEGGDDGKTCLIRAVESKWDHVWNLLRTVTDP